ncbi:DUF892 family protein [uncultured Hymenobacter sp.]|uniref:DUF892 family protein n=1 Tax=uncultured Hymenobacter sp. TaxID=170016 RepID=UPI0035CB30DD
MAAARQLFHHLHGAAGGTTTIRVGLTQVAELLRETLAEEKQATEILTDLVRQRVNLRAEAL